MTQKPASKNKWLIAFALVILIALVILVIRFSSPENDWICKDGSWVKHGNPSSAAPTSLCQK